MTQPTGAPEWTERAENFNELRSREARRWRIIPTAWGGVLAVRDQLVLEDWGGVALEDMASTMPVNIERHEMKDEATARRYIANVATEYALSRWKEFSSTRTGAEG